MYIVRRGDPPTHRQNRVIGRLFKMIVRLVFYVDPDVDIFTSSKLQQSMNNIFTMKKYIFLVTLISIGMSTLAQNLRITGYVVDAQSGQSLPGAAVLLTPASDNKKTTGQSSDLQGKFEFKNLAQGNYKISLSFMGYQELTKSVTLTGQNADLGKLKLSVKDQVVKEVVVGGTMVRQEQKGDTTVFNAEAFKVHADATTEDLLKKMPGITIEGTTIKSGGQQVKKVLVNGKEFFGNDPMLAVKNLPADVIDKIEVYDKQSDQAQFSGFNDGDEERTINIATKSGKNMGRFGKAYVGYGSDDRYEAGGNLNYFKGNQRISIIGLFNNTNQQNFSFDDIVGAMGSGGRGAGMGGNFMTGNLGGITRTNSIGINYSNTFAKKVELTGSYFFNNTNNKNTSEVIREYFPEGNSTRVYNEYSKSTTDNYNHRFNLRLTYQIDSLNSILFTPRVSWQRNENQSLTTSDEFTDAIQQLTTTNDIGSNNDGYSINGDIMFRHKFMKHRRTISLRAGTSSTFSDGKTTTYSLSESINNQNDNLTTNQLADNNSRNLTINTEVVYTEPIGINSALMINYSPSFTTSEGEKTVYDKSYDDYRANYPMTQLSNSTESEYNQHRAGLGYNYTKGAFNMTAGLNYQHASLTGDQTYPEKVLTDKSFENALPSLMVTYRKGRTTNFRLQYRTNTSAPSVSQLQNTVSVSNNRNYSMGNPDLKQQYTHNVMLHFAKTNPETSRSFFAMARLTATSDYIATSTSIARNDSVIGANITMPKGSQLDQQVNLNGYYSVNGFLTYGFPFKLISSNININLGVNYQNKPGMYNHVKNNTDTYTITSGIVVGSNINENIDFTASYNPGYNILKSSAATSTDYNYYNHTAQLDLNYTFLRRLVFNNSLGQIYYNGLGDGLDQNFTQWNASLAFKFLRDNRAELKFKVYDLLDSNKSISRSITESYVSTTNTQVLSRYCMVTLTFNLKKIGNQSKEAQDPDRPMGPPPGGFRQMGGGTPPPPPGEMM